MWDNIKPDFATPYGVAVFILPWIVSGLGIWMTELTGRKDRKGWAVGLYIQIVWFTFVVITGGFGFLPLNIVRFFQYWRNYKRWRAQDIVDTDSGPSVPDLQPPPRDLLKFGGTDKDHEKYPGL